MFAKMIDSVYSAISSVPFDTLIWIILGTFSGITVLSFVLCFAIPKIREASKRPYLCLVNAYTALVLASFLTGEGLAQSVLASALFWCVGYLLYGMFCFISKPARKEERSPSVVTFMQPDTAPLTARPSSPVAKSSVRLEHAIAVTERLLQKNLSKSDRQELEKLKSTLSVLQLKGELSPAESDILNDNFNALLKLMAKYNI